MEAKRQKGNALVGLIIIIGLIWGVSSLFSDDESESETYQSGNYYSGYSYDNDESDSDYYEEDGYGWAEDNDINSFEECQDQFGTGYEEDECNRYVKDNYSGYNTFNGYDCTEDCSGHEAGYDWAEENDISDEYDCDGNSSSFNEGCASYVEENY
jgi:hypothetical protein